MTRLRVLLITPDFPPRRGGIQLVAHRLVTHFSCATTQVLTLGSGGSRPWDAARPDIAVHRVRAGHDHRLAVLRLNATAVMAARSFRPDVVLVMHIVAAPAAAAIRRALGTPIVTYLHAKEVPTRPRLARFAVRNSQRIVAVSRHTASLAAGAGADMSRVTVIPPGVDWHEPPREPRLATPTVVTVARLEDRHKGHDVMVRAMALVRDGLSDAQWLVVGDGPLRCAIERLATAEGVRDAIRLCGSVSDQARDHLLNRAHVFAMPSRVPANGGGDGFGIVYLEAGVHELPVIAGRAGGAQDAVIDGTTGLLVDPTDQVQVAAAISRLLLDRASAARMGAAGRERARAFTWPRIASRVEELMAETARRA